MNLRGLAMSMAAVVVLAGTAAAQQCETFPDAVTLPADGPEFLVVQQAVSGALGIGSPLLADGKRGPVSDAALTRLCAEFPGHADGDPVLDSVDLLNEFIALRGLVPDWRDRVLAPGMAEAIDGVDGAHVVVALAGVPALKAGVLMDASPSSATACAALPVLTDAGAAGLAALESAGLVLSGTGDSFARYCKATPLAGDVETLSEAMLRFDMLEAEYPGAISVLASPEFAQWLLADAPVRLPRLLGTPATVTRLMRDFQPEAPVPMALSAAATGSGPAACQVDGSVVQYWSFGPEEFARLSMANDTRAALEALIGPSPGPDAVLATLRQAMGPDMSPCLEARMAEIVMADNSPARLYWLDETAAQQVELADDPGERQAVVAGLVGRSADSREALLALVEDGLRRSLRASFDTEIAAAIAVIADAAENLPTVFDRPAPGMPEPEARPQSTTLVITALTRQTADAVLQNRVLRQAFAETDLPPQPNRALLEASLRDVFLPVSQIEIARILERDMVRVAELVRVRWAITPGLIETILTLPELASFTAEEAALTHTRLGLEYPTVELMRQAFAALRPALPEQLQEAAVTYSARTVRDPDARRVSGPVAEPGCGCVMGREEHARVYGFYPFWFFPTETATDGEGAEDAETPAEAIAKVDFGLVDQIAFYGPQWVAGEQAGVLELRFQSRWLQHRRDFVYAAHRHRADADLAIRLTGWEDWTESQIETVVANTDRMMAPFARYDVMSADEARRFLPTLFDLPQPDGLTLIIDGYVGGAAHPAAERLVSLVNRIAQPLSERGQSLHLGFELDLDQMEMADSLFDDLAPLLERDIAGESVVENLLVFLEQPTAQTARIIRQKLDGGTYRADVRTDILRRILPVVPPAGARFVDVDDALELTDMQSPRGRFLDKLVYFQDNFAGIGFWPVPIAGQPGNDEVAEIISTTWNAWRFPDELAPVEEGYMAVCAFVCPNRFYFSASAASIATMVALLVVWSFYSGVGHSIAYRWHLVSLGNITLLALLILMTTCDPDAFWAPVFLMLLGFVLVVSLLFNTYQYARNGPKP